MNQSDGRKLLKFARDCVYSELFEKELNISPEIRKFSQKQGVFVTIHKRGELRGCIGFVIGHFPLYEGIKNAAHSAAFEDPRFPPVDRSEWDDLDFEISVLSVPEEIKAEPSELPKKIEIGKDGLICESGPYSGLLLPQVATEWKWGAEEFLSHTCMKAGLPAEFWKTGKCRFRKFRAEVFS